MKSTAITSPETFSNGIAIDTLLGGGREPVARLSAEGELKRGK